MSIAMRGPDIVVPATEPIARPARRTICCPTANDTQPGRSIMPNLIQCGDHKLAPWCAVCKHILRGATEEYVRIAGRPGEQDDLLCPACFAIGPDDLDINELAAVC